MNVNNASAETTKDFLRTLDLENRSKNNLYVLTETNHNLQRDQAEKGNALPKNWSATTAPPIGHNGGVTILFNNEVWKTKATFKPEVTSNKRETIVHMVLFRTIEPGPQRERINSVSIWGIYLNPLQIRDERKGWKPELSEMES